MQKAELPEPEELDELEDEELDDDEPDELEDDEELEDEELEDEFMHILLVHICPPVHSELVQQFPLTQLPLQNICPVGHAQILD